MVKSSPPGRESTRVPVVIVKPPQNIPKEEVLLKVTNHLQKKVIVPVDHVAQRKDGSVAIRCRQSSQVTKTEELLTSALGSSFEVKTEALLKPRVMVVRIDTEQDLDSLVNDINARSFQDFESDCSGIHAFRSKKKNLLNVIIELSPELYAQVRRNNYKLYVGHQKCRVYDDLNVKLCYKCGRFGHSSSKCRNEACCLYCAEAHEAGECRNWTKLKCSDCVHANENHGAKLKVNHCAIDCVNCDILKRKINKCISSTDYPITPIIPKYAGRVVASQPATKASSRATGQQRSEGR